MSILLDRVVALTRAAARDDAAVMLGELLGGDRVVVFVRDEQIGVLLPAPGFPQTLPDGRAWRRFVDACAMAGEGHHSALARPDGGAPGPAIGISCGADAVAVVVGASECTPAHSELRSLLPLLASTFRGERAAANAAAQERLARQAAARAEALATALDVARGALQGALADAEAARSEVEEASRQLQDQATELEVTNVQLQEQAGELEAQAEELVAQAEQLERANAQLSDARCVADAANKSKSDFLANMSHELRTPLNAIGGYASLMLEGIRGPVTDVQRSDLDRIKRSQHHLLALINDILNFAKIEAGRVRFDLTDVSMNEALGELEALIAPQLIEKQLRYSYSCCDPRFTAHVDLERLHQILLNLLSNAVKFTPPGGEVTVQCDATPDHMIVRVHDTGEGIPADKLEHIFEPFVQLDRGHAAQRSGTGLGLAISRDLARAMGGDLTAESTLDVGSTFTLSFPRRAREAAPRGSHPVPGVP